MTARVRRWYGNLSDRLGVLPAIIAALALAVGLRVVDANPAVAQSAMLNAWRAAEDPGLDATAGIWRAVPGIEVALSAQTSTYPTGGGFGVAALRAPVVTARALHFEDRLYVALEWEDGTVDDRTFAAEGFADAAAVQFPARAGTGVPAVCMGQADQSVNIWHWRADTQRGLPTRPLSGYTDASPSTDPLDFPAREAGNVLADPAAGPVQNLVAGGFGTLEAADGQPVDGHGARDGARWRTVFARSFGSGGPLQPDFGVGTEIDTAFAVWNGSLDQRNGMKSVTSFVRLRVSDQPVPSDDTGLRILGVLALIAVAGVGIRAAASAGGGARTEAHR